MRPSSVSVCKRLMRKCGLNYREDVFGRGHHGHVAGWNVATLNGEGYNWSVEKNSELEAKTPEVEKCNGK